MTAFTRLVSWRAGKLAFGPVLGMLGAMRIAAVLTMTLLLCGCESHGVSYGLFTATGELTESCSDAGLLAAPEAVRMRVHLRRVGAAALHWNHGDGLMIGDVDPENSFRPSTLSRVDMREGDTTEAPCSVDHQLSIEGEMWGPTGAVDGFEAVMANTYVPVEGSSCEDLLEGPEALAEALPCTVSYDISGARDED